MLKDEKTVILFTCEIAARNDDVTKANEYVVTDEGDLWNDERFTPTQGHLMV